MNDCNNNERIIYMAANGDPVPPLSAMPPGSDRGFVDVTTTVKYAQETDLGTWFNKIGQDLGIAPSPGTTTIKINNRIFSVAVAISIFTEKPYMLPGDRVLVYTPDKEDKEYFIGPNRSEILALCGLSNNGGENVPAAVSSAVGGAGTGGGASSSTSATAATVGPSATPVVAPTSGSKKPLGPLTPQKTEMPMGSNVAFVKVSEELLCGGKTPLAAWFQRMRTLKAVTPGDPTKEIKISYEGQSLTLYEPVNKLTRNPFAFPEGYIFLASRDNLDFYVGPKPVAATAAPRRNSRRKTRRRASRRRLNRR